MADLSITLRNLLNNLNYQYAMASKQNASNISTSAQQKNENSKETENLTASAKSVTVNNNVTVNKTTVNNNSTTKTSTTYTSSLLSATLSSLFKKSVSVSNVNLYTSGTEKKTELDNISVISNNMETEFFKSYKNANMTAIYNKLNAGSTFSQTDLKNFEAQISKMSKDEQNLWKSEIQTIKTKIENNLEKISNNNNATSINNSLSSLFKSSTTAASNKKAEEKTKESKTEVVKQEEKKEVQQQETQGEVKQGTKNETQVLNGFVSNVLYKNGEKFTGVYTDGKYYSNGEAYNGMKSGALYKDGVAFTGTNNGKFYQNGILADGVVDGKYYSCGSLASGTINGKYYVSGEAFNGMKSGALYKDGVAFTGTTNGKLYQNGLLADGVVDGKYYSCGTLASGTVNGKTYVNGILQETATATVAKKETASNGDVKGYDSKGNLVYLEKTVNGKKVVYDDELQYVSSKTIKYLTTVDESVLNDRLLDDIKMVQNAEKQALTAGAKGTSAYEKAYNETIKSQMIKTTSNMTGAAGEVVEKSGVLYVNDGNGLKKLNISAETYMELFPPVERYDINQSSISDCYFVSAGMIDTMKNDKTFAQLLQMFSEDNNGNVTVKFAGSLKSYPVTFSNGDLKVFDGKVGSTSVKKYSNALGAKGLQMLEQAYAIARFSEESNRSVSSIDIDETVSTITGGWQYNVYDELLGIKSERKYVKSSEIGSYLDSIANDVNNGKMLFSFDSYADIDEYNMVYAHAYSVESIDKANKVVYLSNPWFGGGSIAVPYSVFAKTAWNDKIVTNIGYLNA